MAACLSNSSKSNSACGVNGFRSMVIDLEKTSDYQQNTGFMLADRIKTQDFIDNNLFFLIASGG